MEQDEPKRTRDLFATLHAARATERLGTQATIANAPRLTVLGTGDPPSDSRPTAVNASIPDASVVVNAGDRYAVGALLGVGGMGEVRLYKDRRIGRHVALKTVRLDVADNDAALQRFVREVRVQGQLEHPAVVPVYDFGVAEDGRLYFTMRRVQGRTLEDVLAALDAGDPEVTAAYSRRKLLTAFASVCLALHYAHTRGVVHRDLKPGNVMLGDFGEVYLLDWGIAKLADAGASPVEMPEGHGEDTGEGALAGTPAYMAPEQLRGRNDLIDARTDVYALGLILFEALARGAYHKGKRLVDIASEALAGIDARPSLRAPGVPPELDAICARATALDPAARFQTARELADAVERYLDGDRDTARRRELAAEHVAAAGRAARDEEGRAEAMREVVTALALDPENEGARKGLVGLLTDVPERMPRGAEREYAAAAEVTRREAMRSMLYGWLTWVACIPVAFWLGVKNWAVMGPASALVVLGALMAAWMTRREAISRGALYAHFALGAVTVAGFSAWLGPFMLVPSSTAAVAVLAAGTIRREERPVLIALCLVTTMAPLAAEWLGLVPPSYAFEPGRFVLLERAVALRPGRTLAALVFTSATLCTFAAIIASRLRDRLSDAERQLFLHAWHLRRLVAHDAAPPRRAAAPAPPAV